MNDDIIRMAREAGFTDASFCRWSAYTDDLKRFADIVRAAEQDRCCRIIFGMAGSDNVAQRTVEKIRGKE